MKHWGGAYFWLCYRFRCVRFFFHFIFRSFVVRMRRRLCGCCHWWCSLFIFSISPRDIFLCTHNKIWIGANCRGRAGQARARESEGETENTNFIFHFLWCRFISSLSIFGLFDFILSNFFWPGWFSICMESCAICLCWGASNAPEV